MLQYRSAIARKYAKISAHLFGLGSGIWVVTAVVTSCLVTAFSVGTGVDTSAMDTGVQAHLLK